MDFLGGLFNMITPGAGSLLGGLGSGLASFFGQGQTNQANQQMQQQAEAYNTQMSNTAYQRASADMTKAGLNPMMMFGSGGPASTPQAPMVQKTSGLQAAAPSIQNTVNSAIDAQVKQKTMDQMTTAIANTKAQTLQSQAQSDYIMSQTARSSSLLPQDLQRAILDNKARDLGLPVLQSSAQQAQNVMGMWPNARKAVDISQYSASGVSSLANAAKEVYEMYKYGIP